MSWESEAEWVEVSVEMEEEQKHLNGVGGRARIFGLRVGFGFENLDGGNGREEVNTIAAKLGVLFSVTQVGTTLCGDRAYQLITCQVCKLYLPTPYRLRL